MGNSTVSRRAVLFPGAMAAYNQFAVVPVEASQTARNYLMRRTKALMDQLEREDVKQLLRTNDRPSIHQKPSRGRDAVSSMGPGNVPIRRRLLLPKIRNAGALESFRNIMTLIGGQGPLGLLLSGAATILAGSLSWDGPAIGRVWRALCLSRVVRMVNHIWARHYPRTAGGAKSTAGGGSILVTWVMR